MWNIYNVWWLSKYSWDSWIERYDLFHTFCSVQLCGMSRWVSLVWMGDLIILTPYLNDYCYSMDPSQALQIHPVWVEVFCHSQIVTYSLDSCVSAIVILLFVSPGEEKKSSPSPPSLSLTSCSFMHIFNQYHAFPALNDKVSVSCWQKY